MPIIARSMLHEIAILRPRTHNGYPYQVTQQLTVEVYYALLGVGSSEAEPRMGHVRYASGLRQTPAHLGSLLSATAMTLPAGTPRSGRRCLQW